MAQQTIDIGSAPNDGTGDPIRDAFDKCNDNFTELYGSLAGLLDFQGATDCSANPNYPAASQGDIYIVSVAGKIGGASGKVVEVGDFYLALADNAGGTEASVGTSWAVLQANITGGIGAGVDVEDEGVSETVGATVLNFVGAGVTAADAGGGVVDITIPGGGGISGIDIEDEGVAEASAATTLNFTGVGVTATDVGGGQVDISIPGGLDYLGEQVASASATLNFTGLISAAYDDYVIEFVGLVPATNAVTLKMRMSTNNGSSYDSSGIYSWTAWGSNRLGEGRSGNDGTDTSIQCNQSTLTNTATYSYNGHARLFSPSSTSLYTAIKGTSGYRNTTNNEDCGFGGFYQSTTAVDAFQFFFSSGNIASGTIRVYGVKKP